MSVLNTCARIRSVSTMVDVGTIMLARPGDVLYLVRVTCNATFSRGTQERP